MQGRCPRGQGIYATARLAITCWTASGMLEMSLGEISPSLTRVCKLARAPYRPLGSKVKRLDWTIKSAQGTRRTAYFQRDRPSHQNRFARWSRGGCQTDASRLRLSSPLAIEHHLAVMEANLPGPALARPLSTVPTTPELVLSAVTTAR